MKRLFNKTLQTAHINLIAQEMFSATQYFDEATTIVGGSINLPTRVQSTIDGMTSSAKTIIFKALSKTFPSEFHQETLGAHLVATAVIASTVAPTFGIDPDVAAYTAFFHDIGKPFARRILKTGRSTFVGHAHLGARYLTDLGASTQEAMVVSQHMCCALKTEGSDFSDAALEILSASGWTEENFRLLLTVWVGDVLGVTRTSRPSKEDVVTKAHTLLAKFKLCRGDVGLALRRFGISPETLIVRMIGVSGSGKSYTASTIERELSSQGWVVATCSRDEAMFAIADEFISSPRDRPYGEVYEAVPRPKVQDAWVTMLNNAFDGDDHVEGAHHAIVIDTVQTMARSWESTIKSLSEDARRTYYTGTVVDVYGFPQHLIDPSRNSTPKTGKNVDLPIPVDASNSLVWPSVSTEVGEGDALFATGVSSEVTSLAKVLHGLTFVEVFAASNTYCGDMLDALIKYETIDALKAAFPPRVLQTSITELDNGDELIEFGYLDGSQSFIGPTDDYRGEVILKDRRGCYKCYRASMPVFPDDMSLSQAPAHAAAIHDASEFFLTTKRDGSMVNVTVNWDVDPSMPGDPQRVIIDRDVVVHIGSKACLNARSNVRDRLDEALRTTSFPSTEAFVEFLVDTILVCDRVGTMTFHFEAVPEMPTSELATKYPRATLFYLGKTTFSLAAGKKFILPFSDDDDTMVCRGLAEQGVVCDEPRKFSSVDAVNAYISDETKRLLETGDTTVDIEGYVMWVWSEARKRMLGIKKKREIYYMAHKPWRPAAAAWLKSIENDDSSTGETLRARLTYFASGANVAQTEAEAKKRDDVRNFIALARGFLAENLGASRRDIAEGAKKTFGNGVPGISGGSAFRVVMKAYVDLNELNDEDAVMKMLNV